MPEDDDSDLDGGWWANELLRGSYLAAATLLVVVPVVVLVADPAFYPAAMGVLAVAGVAMLCAAVWLRRRSHRLTERGARLSPLLARKDDLTRLLAAPNQSVFLLLGVPPAACPQVLARERFVRVQNGVCEWGDGAVHAGHFLSPVDNQHIPAAFLFWPGLPSATGADEGLEWLAAKVLNLSNRPLAGVLVSARTCPDEIAQEHDHPLVRRKFQLDSLATTLGVQCPVLLVFGDTGPPTGAFDTVMASARPDGNPLLGRLVEVTRGLDGDKAAEWFDRDLGEFFASTLPTYTHTVIRAQADAGGPPVRALFHFADDWRERWLKQKRHVRDLLAALRDPTPAANCPEARDYLAGCFLADLEAGGRFAEGCVCQLVALRNSATWRRPPFPWGRTAGAAMVTLAATAVLAGLLWGLAWLAKSRV